jgi:hypothetical protein
MGKKEFIQQALEGLLMSKENSRKMLDKFKKDFFGQTDPLTELILCVDDFTYIRMDNLDFHDKDYMFLN